ncbi:Crp/Fnr family transcriptional regulator [Caproiciproducens sp. LBM24188]|nr:Crp/Fnr family transcriptional regulator [Oscillospiraceae bacterium]HHV32402.1 Crp/Fnr family transcriptional regulator [Clostridiales bacterium]
MDSINNLISIIESNPEIYEYLKNCPYQILKCWSIVSFHKKQKIITQGEICDAFFIMESGLVDVNTVSEDGKQYSHAIYKEGNYLGELEIFDQMEYCCSATALTDVRLLKISRPDFLRWMEIDRNIENVLLRNVCSKFYTLSVKAAEDTFYSLKYRLCEFLLQCAKQHAFMDNEQRLMINKEALSSYLAVTNRSINRITKELKEKGILEVENGFLVIKNTDQLQKELEESKK